MSTPLLGAQMFTVRAFCKDAEGLADTARKIRKIGYTTVQVSGIGPIDPKEVARIMKENDLVICGTHMKWDRFVNELDAVIAEHKLWNCRHPAIGMLSREISMDKIAQFREQLIPIATKLAASGMDFSFHNHDWDMVQVEGKPWLMSLYERIEPQYLKAEIDTHWIAAAGADPAQFIRRYPGRQPLVHFKDFILVGDRERRFAEIGQGNLNWPEIIKAVKEVGSEYILIEQDNCYDRDPFESLEMSYKFLSGMGLK